MSVFSKEGTKLVRKFDAETLWIEPWGKDSLRVRGTEVCQMPDKDWALLPAEELEAATNAVIEIFENYATITNGKIKAEINVLGKIIIYNQKGETILEEFERNRKQYTFKPGEKPSGFASALDIKARDFKPILGAAYNLSMRFESDPEEKIYGMGQYQQPFLNIKGCELELAQRNSQASVPFMISNLGYGFLWNNPGVGRVTFGRNITTWEALSTDMLDYWITAGDTPADIEENYAKVAGTVPMMPDYAMGFWQCKLRYQTQDEILNIAREHKKRGLPISVIVVDFFHWTMQGEWKFDLDYWPDPEGMVKELKEMGIELMVSIWPTVDHESENYSEMVEKGFLVRADRGHRIGMDFHGNTIHYDSTNPEAREYVWGKAKQNYYDKGIKIFWLDEAEPEYTYYDFDLYRYYLGPDVQVGNIYPLMYAQTFYEGMEKEGQKNIINLLRCAWAGSQRFGALVWSGDIHSSFRSLRNQFAAGLNMGIAGIPWWTTDIGGFHGGNPDDPEFREVFVRWFEYGTFCPVMRLHGDREPHGEPLGTKGGGICNSGADNEVWSYGEEAYEICRKYMDIREKLKPYISKLMADAHEKGTPVIRPLFYDFPEDKKAWDIEDAYMFGSDVLVAPVMYERMTSRNVYLPKGEKWKNTWSGNLFEGGQEIQVDTPIDLIPVFVRESSDVVIG